MQQGAIHRETWGSSAVLYAGAHGTLPRKGDKVHVWNFWDDTTRIAIVTDIDPDKYEYTVSFEQMPLDL